MRGAGDGRERVTERSSALPVAMAVWCVPLGLFGVIAAVVRVLERPDHATALCYGSWLSLIGDLRGPSRGVAALRDERRRPVPAGRTPSRARDDVRHGLLEWPS